MELEMQERRSSCVVLLLVLAALVPVTAVGAEPKDHPGFVAIEAMDLFSAQDTEVDINISGSLLSMVAAATRSENPDFAEAVERLVRIRVRVGSLSGERLERAHDRINGVIAGLERGGWERNLFVRDGASEVTMLLRPDGDEVHGMVLMAFDGSQLAMVNLVGTIDPELIGRILAELDGVPELDADDEPSEEE
jgi:hypothetical protein